jgi:hypothetical protein
MLRCVPSLPRTCVECSPKNANRIYSPEIAESVFLAWRLTGDARYRSYAWDIFSAIEAHCRLPGGGYATVRDVDQVPVEYEDKQETFFLVRSSLFFIPCVGNLVDNSLTSYMFVCFAERDAQVPLPDLRGRERVGFERCVVFSTALVFPETDFGVRVQRWCSTPR